MNYAAIKPFDVATGPGVRVSLFVSGCTHQCKNCFNQEAWDFNYGEPFTEKEEEKILNAMKPDYIKGFSLLGGEPFEKRNQEVLSDFLPKIKEAYPEKDIWCYTGYDSKRIYLRAESVTKKSPTECFLVLTFSLTESMLRS